MKKSTVITRLIIFLLILVVINMISLKTYFRLDFTEDKRYTLSDASTEILESLDDVITVKAFFSEDLPAQLISNRQDFEDLLVEYENRSGGNIVYEFISPNEDEAVEAEAQQNGISPIIVNVTEKDQVQQLKAYMGAFLMMGDKKEVIPVVQPGVDMEYGLTTAIKKLSVTDKPKIGLIQGHGEPTLQELTQLHQQLAVLYEVEPFNISDTTNVPSYYRALLLINPQDSIPSVDFQKIDGFMAGGGNVFVSYSNLKGDLSTGYLSNAPDIGVTNWLASKKINMGNQFVIDAECGAVSVRQQAGGFSFSSQVRFPYFPRLSNFSEHPATQGLETILLPFVSSLTYVGQDSAVNYTPLIMTSETSGLAVTPAYADVNKRWQESDFKEGPQILGLALEGPIAGNQNSKLIVISNGSFVINGNPPQQVSPDNVNLTSNAIDWLSDDTGLIDLRTKAITSKPLEPVDDGTREMLKWGNVFVPIVLILIYAFIRRQRNIRKQHHWMQGNY